MRKPPANYQHTVAKIETQFDQRGQLYVRFLFFLGDGSHFCFKGPRGQWLWIRTQGRTEQEVQLRIQKFMRKALQRVFGLTDLQMHQESIAGGGN
jgi:hypothetical protein